jgi:3-deoxy-D-manno-octulosonic-acid transferase
LGLFLYNLSINTYKLFITLAAFLGNTKARLWLKGRRNVFDYLHQKIAQQSPKAWFHCASLGEFEQARPVLEAFRKKYPHFQIVLTFFSPSGYEVRKNYDQADVICYLPSDSSSNAKTFLQIVQPRIIFWTKYEFWYHYLSKAHQLQIPTLLFSAIFRKNQLFFKFYGGFYRNILSFFSHIFVQDAPSLSLLQSVKIKHCSIAPDTRFDRVFQIASQAKNFDKVEQFKNGVPLFIVGSMWSEDWAVIKHFLKTFKEPLKVIIAPHEIHEKEILSIKNDLKGKTLLFSEINQVENVRDFDNLIINNVGYLSTLYRYADFAWIGGGYKQGLHNILEPATFGMPIFFGNKAYQKFREAQELISLGGAFSIKNVEEFLLLFSKLYSEQSFLSKVSAISRNFVEKNIGGTQQVLQKAEDILTKKINL